MQQEFDDLAGETLDEELVKEACREEIEMFRNMEVYEYVERSKAVKGPPGKIAGVRWVKVNKGSQEAPKVRCRLVAQEFAGGEVRDDLFAGSTVSCNEISVVRGRVKRSGDK